MAGEKMGKTVIINASAIDGSGALVLLKSLVEYLEKMESNNNYILFTCLEQEFKYCRHINVIIVNAKSWIKRIAWDNGGLRSWCLKMDITPNLIVSMQNTCTKFPGIPQLVYFHQAIAILPYKWNPLHADERLFFLYATFYPFFVNMNNGMADYVVQLPYLKKLLCKRIPSISFSRIHVIPPDGPNMNIAIIKNAKLFKDKRKVFLYPATELCYKNHQLLLDAIVGMDQNERDLIRLVFTVKAEGRIAQEVQRLGLKDVITCIGDRPYAELLGLYQDCHGMLFPSRIESYGMPLVEASCFGLPILVSDLPYAHEVLNGYKNTKYLIPDNSMEWKNAIIRCLDSTKLECKLVREENAWREFTRIIDAQLDVTK